MEVAEIGKQIKKRRIELNVKINQLAEKCDVSCDSIRGYERGRKKPSLKTYFLICEALEMSPWSMQGKPHEARENINRTLGMMPSDVIEIADALVSALYEKTK